MLPLKDDSVALQMKWVDGILKGGYWRKSQLGQLPRLRVAFLRHPRI